MSVATLANITIAVQRQTETRDSLGGITKTWASVLKLKARVQPLSAREQIMHSKDDARITHKVYVAGAPDVRATDRISFSKLATGRHLYIHGVRNIDILDTFLTIECEERDDGD